MSGKQEGISNDDTHHTSQIAKQDEKSKKGEGVAETAKLKGTVSTDRPGVSLSSHLHITPLLTNNRLKTRKNAAKISKIRMSRSLIASFASNYPPLLLYSKVDGVPVHHVNEAKIQLSFIQLKLPCIFVLERFDVASLIVTTLLFFPRRH